MADGNGAAGQPSANLVSLPTGGGAIAGIGESFQPDLHTGTGNLTVPLDIPPGRGGLKPSLALAYSTGSPNGPFGLGWQLPVPGVRRKTDKGIPRYDDALDTFVLSGAEDLVPVPGGDAGATRYRPRAEAGYARITHVAGPGGDYWEVWSTDGLRSRYGTPRPAAAAPDWTDPAVIADPGAHDRIFGWLLSETTDPLGNTIAYAYQPDAAGTAQRYLAEVSYADYGDPASPGYLVTIKVVLDTAPRPDPFSDHRPGFELRTTQRAAAIETWMNTATPVLARRVELDYADQAGNPAVSAVSLLARISVTGVDGTSTQALPPVEFGYTPWDPSGRVYQQLTAVGGQLPATSLAGPGMDLVDMFGDGLMSILQLNGTARYWRNAGGGRFDPPRALSYVPAGANLGTPGVQLADFDGDGRPDLLVSSPDWTGYWPLSADGGFDPAGYTGVGQAPTVGLSDPLVRLIDLDGDGITDALRTGDSLELFYNDDGAFGAIQVVPRGGDVPDVTFGDPRVFLADMTGDGLTDIVLAHDGDVSYWPYQGYGSWGAKVVMRNPPRFADAASYTGTGFDPARLLFGDVDGDGCADVVYVRDGTVTVWVNQAGAGFADPVTIRGTPPAAGAALRLADMTGSGIAGVLWSYDLGAVNGSSYKFLDLTGGTKPYLLNRIDNHSGAVTTISYATSSGYAIADRAAGNPWRTTLPFPVHVVASTTVTDYFSGTILSSEYGYHHGYWDGGDREFRGFARVDQRDTLTATGPAPAFYSPPTETRTWFHLGLVGPEAGDWIDGVDLTGEYWQEDLPLAAADDTSALPAGMDRRGLRSAIRALRGRVLRSELYALDGDPNAGRPYEVSDGSYALAPVLDGRPVTDPGWQAAPVVAVQPTSRRTTIWERGTDPMTRATLTGGYDDYGRPHQAIAIAVPRGRDPRVTSPAGAEAYLATMTLTEYATRDDATHYLIGRQSVRQRLELREDTAVGGAVLMAFGRQQLASPPQPAADTIRSLTLTYYDGPAFEGLPTGQLGDWGLRTRVERLSLTPQILTAAYGVALPPYLGPGAPSWTAEYPAAFRDAVPALGGYQYHDAIGPYLAGWYAQDERVAYDVQQGAGGRGLVTARRDPLGNDTLNGYDGYQLLAAKITEPSGLTRSASYDYRVLRPVLITDPNGNQWACGYTPLGLPSWLANTGKPGGNEGDTPAQPGTMFAYDLTAWDDNPANRQPMSVRTTRRVNHRWTLVDAANAQRAAKGLPPLTDAQIAAMFPPDEVGQYPDRFIQKAEFTDGFGRLMQTRAQADDTMLDDLGLTADMTAAPGPVRTHQLDPTAPPQVVVSGWQGYDNKGRVVEKYEPAFDTGWAYRPPATTTQAKVVTNYDPRGLAIRTVYPDGSEQLLVPGIPPDLTDPGSYQPTPWETFTYDNNDNAGRTSPATSAAWSSHWNTPSSELVDALGRVIEHAERAVAGTAPVITRSAYDIDGNLLTVTDALGRVASLQVYDLKGGSWRRQLIDAGVTRVILDAAGGTLERRDASGAMRLGVTDMLLRPLRLWAREEATGTPTLRGASIYGDDAAQSGLSAAAAAAANLLGRPYRIYDEAGRVETAGYDLDGNLLEKTRSTLAATVIVAALPGPAGNWNGAAYQADWQPAAGQTIDQHASPLLEATPYTVSTAYDALGRPTSVTAPLDAEGTRKILLPAYSRSGALTALTVDGVACVTQILHNARGQRALAVLGCGVMIRYVYDPLTFRLARLRSESAAGAAPPVQDYGYAYDLVGNVLSLHDRTPGSGISPAPDALDRAFAYDPLYRLTSATGRECDVPPPTPWPDTPRCTDLTQVRAYTETYGYDLVGSLLRLAHSAANGSFVRSYDIPAAGNQVTAMVTGSTTYGYGYDARGNLVSETTSRLFEWNHAGQLATFRTQTPNSEPSLYAEYRYDGSGRRVMKIVRKQGGQLAVTVYIGRLFERTTLTGTSNHDTLHVLDGSARVAIIRAGPPLPGDASPPTAYHLADHLGSSTVVLDGSGAFVNREEYTPYGETTFGSYALKRYRYTGKERDEESGLYYFGARYHCPWLARWTSTDPSPKPAWSGYRYAADNPLAFTDPSGAQDQSAPSAGVLSTPSETGTAGEGCGPVQFVPQEGGGYTTGPPPAPSTNPADAGTSDAGDSNPKAGEASEESHALEVSVKIAAKTSIGGSTTKADATTSETKPAEGSPLKVSAELKWSVKELETPGLKTESKSYNEFGETGTWSKVTVGSASAHFITVGRSLEGPSLSLLDAQATAVTAEYGVIVGHWYGGLTGTADLTADQANVEFGVEKGSLKTEIGLTFGTARLQGGFNLLGLNVSIYGEITAGVKLGVSAGEETSVRAGFVGVGLVFGAAKSSEARAGWLNFMEDLSKAIPEWLQFTGAQNTPFFGGF